MSEKCLITIEGAHTHILKYHRDQLFQRLDDELCLEGEVAYTTLGILIPTTPYQFCFPATNLEILMDTVSEDQIPVQVSFC